MITNQSVLYIPHFNNIDHSFKMQIGIIIPLKSQTISKNWQVTCQALYATLQSLQRQSSQNFKAVVVGHEHPDLMKSQPENISFMQVKFPPPNREASDFSHMKLVEDKNLKIVSGLKYLSQESIDYWYQLDSDDLLSEDFIEYLSQNIKQSMGAVIDGGYLVYPSLGRFIPSDDMSQYCGSTSILKNGTFEIPKEISPSSIKAVPWASNAHKDMNYFFQSRYGNKYSRFTKPLLGYVLNSGDNISDSWRNNFIKRLKFILRPYVLGNKIDETFRAKFGLGKKS